MSTRKVLIQRLEDLGEFGERLNDSSMTQYKRKQALKENLPADFVKERKEEIEAKGYTHVLTLLGAPIFILIVLSDYLGFGPGIFSSDFVTGFVITAGVGFLFAGGYRIYRLANYYRRMEIYTVLHELDKASEGSWASASAESNVSTQNREFAPASAAA